MPIRKMQIPENARWVPKNGEVYFLLLGDGTIQSFQWHGTDFDQNAWSFGNCFRSRREATQAREVIKEVLGNFHKHG